MHDYYPFGEERPLVVQEGAGAGGFDREEPMKFTGQERDFAGGEGREDSHYIDYMHARYYSPTQGRFLSPDPLLGNVWNPQSWNRYAYVLNNPMRFTDPTGLCVAIATNKGFRFADDDDGDGVGDEFQEVPPGPQRMAQVEAQAAKGDRFAQSIISDRNAEPTLGPVDWAIFGLAARSVGLLGDLLGSAQATINARPARSFSSPMSFTGAKTDEVRQAIPQSWGDGVPIKNGGGIRWFNPAARGEGVRIMPGTPGARDPMHAGPYAVFTRNGEQIRVPLAGNPVLKSSILDAIAWI